LDKTPERYGHVFEHHEVVLIKHADETFSSATEKTWKKARDGSSLPAVVN